MSQTTQKAKQILQHGLAVPKIDELKHLIGELKGEFAFGLARKVLSKAREQDPANTWVVQQLALCTYKDEELLPATRFADALMLLEAIGLRDPDQAIASKTIEPQTLPETLGLGGAVHKRKWEYGGQLEDLHQALAFYLAAWERDVEQSNAERDMGYGGVNAAYVMDVLASRARMLAVRSGIKAERANEANEFGQSARKLRQGVLALVPKLAEKTPDLNDQYWFLVTVAETHFGLEHYEEAGRWLARARQTKTNEWKKDEWQRQTTFKQLVSLARLQGCTPPAEGTDVTSWHPAWQALYEFLQEDTEPALSCYRGKVGLALSGGGFRASLFHLGVLARLAEMDVLRAVEVLSTVSGGSIVAAHYYLEVQRLLETKKDSDTDKDQQIGRDDYVQIVRRVQERFLGGVQQNLRTRALASLKANLWMIYSKEYSRSHRLGELYETHLYQHIGQKGQPWTEPRAMGQLLIRPAGQQKDGEFKPWFSNWRRRAKVPVLLLNATSLNSGHSWHFTGRWMGEPPGSVTSEVDVNQRYRRLWYEQASKPEHKDYRLGYAVAASACVPGLFEPLALEGLYPGRTVRLVDGGVHDNQGTEGLLAEGCTLVLCSDASGQMDDQKRPSDTVVGVPLRANSILMDRVREAQYQDLRARVDSHALQGLFFIHLKKGLTTPPIDWTDCDDPTAPPSRSGCTTDYGVDKALQGKLAAIRTDLDSFTEVEAYALMLSGYLMSEHEFKELNKQHQRDGQQGMWGGFDINAPRGQWPFLELESLVRQPPDSSNARRTDLAKQLDAGSSLFFKIWKLSPMLRGISWVTGAGTLGLVLWLIYTYWSCQLVLRNLSVGNLTIIVVLLIAGTAVPILRWLRPHKALRDYIGKAAAALFGFVLSQIHLRVFDPLFKTRGKLERLMKLR